MIEEARALRRDGFTWVALGRLMGANPDTARFYCDDEYRERRRARKWNQGRTRYLPSDVRVEPNRVDPELIRALRSAIPVDDRDLTARFFGDPVYSRSSLAKKQQAQSPKPFLSIGGNHV